MRQSFKVRDREWSEQHFSFHRSCLPATTRYASVKCRSIIHRVLQNSLPGNSGKVSELLTVRGETVSLFELTMRNSQSHCAPSLLFLLLTLLYLCTSNNLIYVRALTYLIWLTVLAIILGIIIISRKRMFAREDKDATKIISQNIFIEEQTMHHIYFIINLNVSFINQRTFRKQMRRK